MPKMKTNKTFIKRLKVSKSGKPLKKKIGISHLNRKWTASRRTRKRGTEEIVEKGYIKMIKKLAPSLSGKIK